jgi:hypothetical protein
MKKLKPHKVDWAQIERFLASAEKKLASAHKILAFDEEACLQQAYEAMLKASLGFMFSPAFRARSQPGHHIAIIDFVRARIDKKHAGLLTFSTVSGGSEIWPFMTTPDSFLTMTPSRPSKPGETT